MRRVRSRLQRLRETSGEERVLLLRAALVVLVVRVALLCAGVSAAKRSGLLAAGRTQRYSVDRMAWSVAVVGAYVPGMSCLAQALALEAMLARAGHSCRVELGVVKDLAFQAHAWVVAGDRIVLGGTDLERYCPIGSLD